MLKNSNKIETLTSLRFIAAFMIIMLHSNGTFFLYDPIGYFNLDHGVSLFFVLSGFILTYVYPQLKKQDVPLFIKARFARLWPTHAASLLLLLALMHTQVQPWNNGFYMVITTAMVSSWIPIEKCFFTINAPSWSLSTEFFFYLCFPFLIYKLARTWHIKLLATLAITVGIIYICNWIKLPIKADGIDGFALVCAHPLSRLSEFVMGMCTALFFNKYQHRIKLPLIPATIVELLAVTLFVYSLRNALYWYHDLFGIMPQTLASVWVTISGGCGIFISLLILCLAFQQGLVSRVMRVRPLILLGEISYSLYLIHYTFLSYFNAYKPWFVSHYSPVQIYATFWIVILSTAYLMWRFVEVPARRFIMSRTLWPFGADKAIGNEPGTPVLEGQQS